MKDIFEKIFNKIRHYLPKDEENKLGGNVNLKEINMNEILTRRIIEYVNQKTNYAVIITGNYGIGKTYYIDNILTSKVLEIKDSLGKQKFKFIRISLFGVSTIEEIHKNIFFEIYSPFKGKVVPVIGRALKGMVSHFGGVDIDQVLKDMKLEEFSDYGNIILCLDDIDRKSSNLNLEEIYGFINDLVENKGAKVILIANEDTLIKEINGKNKDDYSILKEKVIGITLPFNSNHSDIINSMIGNYNDNPEYMNFLKEKSSYIIEMTSVKDNNLRNVLFFLEHFKNIFREVENIINEDEKLKITRNDILDGVIKFSLPLIFEYKLGKLNNENQNLLRDYFDGNSISRLLNNDREKDYVDEFNKQYGYNGWKRIVFINQIFNYIIGKDVLNKESLKEEIQTIYQTNIERLSEKEQIFQALNGGYYWNFMKLDYDDYLQKVRDLIRLIDENQILLREYAMVFHYIIRLDNPLKEDIEKLKNKIIEKINTNDYEYEERLDTIYYNRKPYGDEYAKYFEEIIDACLDKNNQIKNESERKGFEMCLDDITVFFKILEKGKNTIDISYEPFFAMFDFERYWSIIEKASNYQKIQFGYFITQRYKREIYPDLKEEEVFIKQLKTKLEETLKKQNSEINNMDKEAIGSIINGIDKVLPNF